MNPSGNPTSFAPWEPASSISRQAFSTEPSRFRNTGAACTAATRTLGYVSPKALSLPLMIAACWCIRNFPFQPLMEVCQPPIAVPANYSLLTESRVIGHSSRRSCWHIWNALPWVTDGLGPKPLFLHPCNVRR